MRKILVTLLIIILLYFTCLYQYSYAIKTSNNDDLFFPDITERTNPEDLLVMVFLYDDYPNHNDKIDYIFNMTDEEIKTKYHNEIFGSGNIEEQTWSVNDFYKENSNGKFYFNPILFDNNTYGVYPIRFNKTYDSANFSSDIQEGFTSLTEKGLIASGFRNKQSSGLPSERHVLCIFPRISIVHVGTYSLTEEVYANVAVTDFTSVLSTITHELGHSLEMPDLYNQGGQPSLMGETTLYSTIPDLRYPGASNNYTIPAHVDPLHKITLGWYDYEIVDENKTITLYPTTSSSYNIAIVPTNDNNQYYIIENRKANSFETQINQYASKADYDDPEDAGYSEYEGINIWRVDKLGYNNLHNDSYNTLQRNGDFIISVLKNPLDSFFPKKYSNEEDVSSILKENTNIKITYVKKNPDNSVDVNIIFDDKFVNPNSYTVRYNANDGTNNYIDNVYTYTQNINFPTNLFSRDNYIFSNWNTEADGSGTNYDYHDTINGLSDEEGAIINLYAQWGSGSYKVQFDAGGGTGNMPDQTDIIGEYILPECEFTNSNSNLIFSGWLIEGESNILNPGTPITINSNIKLIAQWQEKEKYTVTFNTNGGSPIESQIVLQGDKAIEPDIPIKEGYIFFDWYEDSTYSSRFYFDEALTANITLYARWISNDKIIKNMNIEVPYPNIGDKTIIEKKYDYWDWLNQKPQLDIKVPKDANYKLMDDNNAYMFWVTNFEDEMEPFIGTFEYNKDYYIRTYFVTTNGYYFDKNMQILVNNKQVDKVFYVDRSYIELGIILNIPKEEKPIYKILEGENQTYYLSKGNDLVIKTNGELSKFKELKIDNVKVESSNYSLVSGSTIVTLKGTYLNTLLPGEHNITFVYSDGVISTKINILKENNKNETSTNNPTENNNNAKNQPPQTGDKIIIWLSILIISFIGIIITTKLKKREE